MPELGFLSGRGPAIIANIAGFDRSTARYLIGSNTSSPRSMEAAMISKISLWACHRCNLHKGPNLSGIDPTTGEVEVLFHPRRDRWADHFLYRGAYVLGLIATGRATVAVLALNDARRLELRKELLATAGSEPFTFFSRSDRP